LYYYGARFYDPALGRFASPDSIIPQTQGTQAWDRYSYTFNNPVKYNDPSGHCPWCVVGALAGAAVGYGAQVYNNYQNGATGSAAWTQNISAEPIVGGALIGAGAVMFAPAVVAAAGDVLVGAGVATGSTALFGVGMSAYGASTALGNAIAGAPAVTTAPTLSTPNEIGAWGEQQVGANLPVQIQQVRVPGAGRIYDGYFTNNPQAYLEVKTSTRGVVYATQAIRDQIATDSSVGANLGTSPTWIYVNARPSGPLVNLMQQNRIPWHQLNVPWE
jgi:hypothetical protein